MLATTMLKAVGTLLNYGKNKTFMYMGRKALFDIVRVQQLNAVQLA